MKEVVAHQFEIVGVAEEEHSLICENSDPQNLCRPVLCLAYKQVN